MTHSVGKFLGGEVVQGTGASKNAPGVPEGVNVIWVMARGADVYANLNGAATPTTAPMYVKQDTVRIFGPFDNIQRLSIYGTTSAFAHIIYEKSPE